MKQGDLPGAETEFMLPVRNRRADRVGVRASKVAMKSRNGDGAKGTREGGYVTDVTTENKLAAVPETATQAGEIRARWAWVEPSVWTERMLTALEEGVKGGKWYSLMDKVYAMPNLRAAFARVKGNGGAAGADHQTIEMYELRLEENLEKLAQALKEEKYRPQAVKRVWIPKPGSKERRPLGIPTVQDRVVQAALLNTLEPIFERDFAEQSYGFRPNRGCKDALRRVCGLLEAGHTWIVDADLKSYFDTIPHGQMIRRVEEKVSDGRVIRMLQGYLKQEVMDGMESWTPEGGTPQGAIVSPLLSNIYLDPLDQAMAQAGYEMVRYADDFVILCRSEAEAREVLERVQAWTVQAGLTLHPVKTRIVNAEDKGGFDFLGYHFERGMKWPRRKSLDTTPPPPLTPDDPRYPGKDRRYADLAPGQVPLCESLENTVARFLPYWHETIAPTVRTGKRVLIAAHGNSLRALVKYLDNVSHKDIVGLNIPTGMPLVYHLDENLKPLEHYYLGDPETVARAAEAVKRQGQVG